MTLNVLFLCTHNSARSVLAEATLNHIGQGRYRGFSAGSSPRANQQPNPFALETLRRHGISCEGLTSKSWDVFAQSGTKAPWVMDIIITVCDNAAGEVCPFWPGQPATAHWGYADPSAEPGSDDDRRAAFEHTWALIHQQLTQLVALPLAQMSAEEQLAALHAMAPAPSASPAATLGAP